MIIFAGYTKEMEGVLKTNPGLRSPGGQIISSLKISQEMGDCPIR